MGVDLLILFGIVLGCEPGIFSSPDPANKLQDIYRVATKGGGEGNAFTSFYHRPIEISREQETLSTINKGK